MLNAVRLQNFKAFSSFRLSFRGDAYLAGANNAGKSTVLAALRTGERMIRLAERRSSNIDAEDQGTNVPAYVLDAEQVGLTAENLRHEFRNNEVRLELGFSGGSHLTAVWPPEGDQREGPFFYLVDSGGKYIRRPKEVLELIPPLGIVPVLSPVEHTETVLSAKHVRSNLDTQLASRHFRNQLHLLNQEPAAGGKTRLDEFFSFCAPWLPELEQLELIDRVTLDGHTLDLFYREPNSHVEKEIFWAGDGIQIWLQILLHLFRAKDQAIVVLDEPEIFLHPDIQRRLVRLLESMEAQTITATHSPEVLAEASPEAVVWIERTRAGGVTPPQTDTLEQLSKALGSQFNLRLARALRTRVALFVEGKDMKVMRLLASTLGITAVADEVGVAVIPLEGFTNWEHVEPFAWLVTNLLEASVSTTVVLDRDARTDQQVADVEQRLRTVGVEPHVWRRKELESYLLEPAAVSRLTNTSESWAKQQLDDIAAGFEAFVLARQLDERHRSEVTAKQHRVSITEKFTDEFKRLWEDPDWRLARVPPKEVIRALNRELQGQKHPTISARKLASELTPDEIPSEMRALLERVGDLAR